MRGPFQETPSCVPPLRASRGTWRQHKGLENDALGNFGIRSSMESGGRAAVRLTGLLILSRNLNQAIRMANHKNMENETGSRAAYQLYRDLWNET